jgi:phospholipid/cholesterol/gamma-HCH transport system substrate-binding protein
MESRAHALAAGTFAIVLILLAVGMFLWLTRDTTIKTRYVLTTPGNVTGLKAQAPVRYKGLDVGSVESIEFDPARPGDLLVYIRVNDDTPITTRTFAELGLLGVTGLSFVQLLEPSTKSSVASQPRDPLSAIPLQPSLFDRVADSGERLVAQSEAITQRVNRLLDEPRQQELFAAVADIRETTRKFGTLADELRPAAQAVPALAADARRTLGNADALIGDLRSVTQATEKRLVAIDNAAAAVQEGANKFAATADEFRDVSRNLNAVALPRASRLIGDLSRSSQSAQRVLERVGEEPHSLLFGPSGGRPGPGEPGFSFKEQRP